MFGSDDHAVYEAVAADETPPETSGQTVPQAGLRQRYADWRQNVSIRSEQWDIAPDLAQDIGSARWFRGLATLVACVVVAGLFWPNVATVKARPAMAMNHDVHDELRSHMITPLGLGADSGRRKSAAASVIPLKAAPERPQIEVVATLARGDTFTRMLERAGVGSGDAARINALIGNSFSLSDIEPGTQFDLVLGRREAAGQPRPLDALAFRARFDLELEVLRNSGGGLSLNRNPIRVDDTPLRIRGTVGQSLYRSARAAGAPSSAVQAYLKALDNQLDLQRSVRPTDEFDMIISYRRAATGERQAGQLLYAGVDRGGKPKTQLMRWGKDGRFYEASGVGEQRNGLIAPVNGPISSRYGMRRHPILGYRRMHSGQDYRARHGTPIVAVTDGKITSAGRAGGCGLAVRVDHGGGFSTRSCHMSRIAVRRGQSVRRGQVIGYVGSTGLSTGPHLHFETYRNGRSVNPASVRYVTRAQLSGDELTKFRARLAKLKQIEPGAALVDLEKLPSESEEPKREIERVESAKKVEGGTSSAAPAPKLDLN